MTKKKTDSSAITEPTKYLPKKGDKARRIRVQFDIGYDGNPGKIMNGDSDTMPDMSLTVRQLLENHTRGKNSEVEVRQPLYFESEIPNLRDLTDIDQYKQRLQEQLADVNQFIAEEQQQKQDEAEQKAESIQNDSKKQTEKAGTQLSIPTDNSTN